MARRGASGEGLVAQEDSFRAHIALAKRYDKTLMIHDRDAHDDVLRVIDSVGAPDRWVMHCFSGDAEFARRWTVALEAAMGWVDARLAPGLPGAPAVGFVPEAGGEWPLDIGAGAAVCVARSSGGPAMLAAFRADAVPFGDEDLALLGMLGRQATLALDNAVLHAQTRQQARALEEQAAVLEQAMTERSRFFASMSHELRTPLNAILGYGEMLQEGVYGDLSPAQGESLGRMVRSARHLLELVNDVLDISKMEAGKLEMFPEPTELALLLRDVAGTVELQARNKKLELEIRAAEPVHVVTDPGRVRQIMLNLLSNAVKFTDAGSVRVTVSSAGKWAEVRVEDTGPGIAPEALKLTKSAVSPAGVVIATYERAGEVPTDNTGRPMLKVPINGL